MTQITALSNELLLIIFSSIDKITQVAECRLVCKHWSPLAETAMLGHDIVIRSRYKLQSLYSLLVQRSEKVNLIKHLHFDEEIELTKLLQETDLLEKFLRIAVNPKIESLTGDLYDKAYVNTAVEILIDIVEKSPIKFDKLKTLTLAPENHGELIQQLSLHLADSIETMKVDLGKIDWQYVEQLSKFKKLKNLTFNAFMDTFSDFEPVLNACSPDLQKLTLTTYVWNEDRNWKQEDIQKHYGLTELTIDEGDMDHHFANYVVAKFVNLDTINIDLELEQDFSDSKMHLIPSIIKTVPNKDVMFSIPRETDLRNVFEQFKSEDYAMIVEGVDGGDVRLRIHWWD